MIIGDQFERSYGGRETAILELQLRASNNLQYREGHEVFSVVTGGRPLSFSRLISGGSRSSPGLSGENAEGLRLGEPTPRRGQKSPVDKS